MYEDFLRDRMFGRYNIKRLKEDLKQHIYLLRVKRIEKQIEMHKLELEMHKLELEMHKLELAKKKIELKILDTDRVAYEKKVRASLRS